MMPQLSRVNGNFAYFLIAVAIYLLCIAEARRRSTLMKGNAKVCETAKCRRVAKKILENMNRNGNPCEDFYNYACGGWIKKHEIPKGKDEYSAIVELSERNDKRLKRLLKIHNSSDIVTIKKVKDFYKSCLNTTIVDKRAEKPLKDFITKLGSWDMFPDFDENEWDFNKTLQLFHKEYPAEIFFTVDVDVDPKNRTMNIITVSLIYLSHIRLIHHKLSLILTFHHLFDIVAFTKETIYLCAKSNDFTELVT